MEANYKDKLDQLQHVLTEFCKDGTINMVLRLRVLEIIEMRTMGWRMSSTAEEYYTTKIAQFQKREESKGTNGTVLTASSEKGVVKSTKPNTAEGYKVPRSSNEEMRFKTHSALRKKTAIPRKSLPPCSHQLKMTPWIC